MTGHSAPIMVTEEPESYQEFARQHTTENSSLRGTLSSSRTSATLEPSSIREHRFKDRIRVVAHAPSEYGFTSTTSGTSSKR